MGFYHPSVLVEDLKRHGLRALPVDINRSDVRCLPELVGGSLPASAAYRGGGTISEPMKPASAGTRGIPEPLKPASAGTRGIPGPPRAETRRARGPPFA